MIRALLLIGIGGGAGSILRYLVSMAVWRWHQSAFPLGTFLVNIAGCFLIGILGGWLGRVHPENEQLRLLLMTGFCGGFTTFSAFANENFLLLKGGDLIVASLYVAASVSAGLLAVWLGNELMR